MSAVGLDQLPPDTTGLRLARIDRMERLVLCEAVRFEQGLAGVNTVLRRAAISGQVAVGGDLHNHFADALNDAGDIIETVALDRHSYAALKNKWMRCRTQQDQP